MEENVLSGTGNRWQKLGGYTPDNELKLNRYARWIVESYAPTKVISGMALGWDTALAIAALELNIPLIAAVPFRGQEYRWKKSQIDLYNEILTQAQVEIVSTGSYAHWKYTVRDEWMVDNSHGVLALWDGQRHGGTFITVQYAEKVEKPVFKLWPGWETYE